MPEIAKWQQVYSQQKWKNMAGVFCRIVNGHRAPNNSEVWFKKVHESGSFRVIIQRKN